MKKTSFILIISLLCGGIGFFTCRGGIFPNHKVGDKLDSLNGVYVYYNGSVNNVVERNTAPDGYNLGLKYQCVEFVKRYYYLHYKHKMPEASGHAKDFFDARITDGKLNKARGLIQYTNPSLSKPAVGDLVVLGPIIVNPYGHVAIVCKVAGDRVYVIQQNPGALASSRDSYPLTFQQGHYRIGSSRVLGWLRKK